VGADRLSGNQRLNRHGLGGLCPGPVGLDADYSNANLVVVSELPAYEERVGLNRIDRAAGSRDPFIIYRGTATLTLVGARAHYGI
jgi:hypothetical protein